MGVGSFPQNCLAVQTFLRPAFSIAPKKFTEMGWSRDPFFKEEEPNLTKGIFPLQHSIHNSFILTNRINMYFQCDTKARKLN
jgi:hypothetical protein